MLRMGSRRGSSWFNFRHVALHLIVLCLMIGVSPVRSAAPPEQLVALVGGTVIDGNGGAPLHDAVVLIKGGKILQVGSRRQIKYAKTAKVIDVTGKYVLPGLIDMHVHYHDWMGELFLAHGVTTVKDLGNDLEWISTISHEVEQGKVRGPRIFYVGFGLDAPPPVRETHVAVSDPLMAMRAVQLQHQKGASAVKVREKITPELLKAVTQEAHKLGMPVTGHIRSIDAREAALAGIDGLEHASGIVQALTNYPRQADPTKNELQTFVMDLKAFAMIDLAKADELAKFLASKNVALIPTMSGWWRMATDRRDEFAREDAEYAKNPSLVYVAEDARHLLATSFVYNIKNPDDLAQIRAGYKKLQALLMSFSKAGGKILTGSDTFFSVPGLSLQRELMMLVDAGFTPLQAITMATRDSAQFLKKGAVLGTISPGKLADLVVLNASPLDDINNLERVALVMKGGQVVDTSYHADYSVPTPQSKITHPNWLERQLPGFARPNAAK